MISFTLLKRNMKTCFKPFLVVLAVISMYTSVIIYMYNPDFSDIFNEYQKMMPGVMAAAGMTGLASSLLEWIQIYLYGFIMMLFPLIFIIIMIHKLLMGDIDSGSMANLLSTGNSRGRVIRTQVVSALFWIVLLLGMVAAVGIASSEAIFPGELDIKRYLILNASAMFMQFAVAGISFAAACVFSETRHYYMVGAGLPLLFFLIQMVSNMGEKLENLKYVTIYTLFSANDIVAGEAVHWGQNAVLLLLAAALFGTGSWWFVRRDLSL